MSSLRITLRAGERIFLNGAVLKVDRKTTLEFLNDVTFLLEGHVMQAEDARTPVRQLYFVVQTMLMDPASQEAAHTLFRTSHAAMVGAYSSREIVEGLNEVAGLVARDRAFDALKRLRALIPLEDAILNGARPTTKPPVHEALTRLAEAALAPGRPLVPTSDTEDMQPKRLAAGGLR